MAMRTSQGGLGFVDRMKTGWTLTKDSIAVIREYPKLLVFPLLAGIASIVFFALFFLPLVVADVIGGGLEYVVLFVLYFATTFVSTYFSAALVYASNEAFHGRDPGLWDSMSAINGRLGPIVIWSIIAATVSILLRMLENADNPLATIVRALFAIGWSIMTFFIVPVLVFEDVSATSMFKESGRTFKETWGETLGAGFGITGIVIGIGLLLVVVALAVSIPVASVFPGPGILLTVVLVAIALTFTYLLSQTIWGIAKTALYVYAKEGVTPEQFENFDFETLGGRASQSPTADHGTRSTLDD